MKRSLILALLLWASAVSAQHTYYMATPANGGSDSNPCTATQRCATWTRVNGLMVGGDTLVVGDGVYNQQINQIHSGTGSGATAYTTIMAEHDFAATFYWSQSWAFVLDLQNAGATTYNYIIIRGLRFDSGNAENENPVRIAHTTHIKFIRDTFQNDQCSQNGSPFGLSHDDYILLEDVHVWGCGRYMFNLGYSNHIVLRRVVSRWDFNNISYGQWQNSPMNTYDADNVVLENCIVIDSGIWDGVGNLVSGTSALAGGSWNENHGDIVDVIPNARERNITFLGNIFLNQHGMASDPNSGGVTDAGINASYKTSGSTTQRIEKNNVWWDSEAGVVYGIGCDNCGGMTFTPSLDFEHNLYGYISGTYGGGSSALQGVGILNRCADANSSGCQGNWSSYTFINNLLTNNHSYGNDGFTGDYNAYYANGTNYLNTTAGAHDKTSNPGLLYLPRIETSSPLHNAGSDGQDIGPHILTKIGVDGTGWGETGYMDDTGNPLWPFPFESIIKQDMASFGCPSADCSSPAIVSPAVRGFVQPDSVPSSAGTVGCQPRATMTTQTSCPGRLYGGSRTLTSYIWEYLGNACPTTVCNYAQTSDFSVAVVPSSQSVSIGGQTTYTATVTAVGGFSGVVTFSVSGLPANTTALFNPTTVTGSGTSTLTVTTTGSTPAGTSTLTVTGTSGVTVHSTTVTMKVGALALSPGFSPPGGSYSSAQNVTLSNPSGAPVVCWNTTGAPATDGASGCVGSTVYSGPISVTTSEAIYAVAGGTGFLDSNVVTAVYTISSACASLCVGPGQTYTTIQACANVAVPGQTCYVYPGNYAGFRAASAGTAGNPITFCATANGSSCLTSLNNGVVVDGNLGYGDSRGDVVFTGYSYVTVTGFTVQNSSTANISSCLRADPSTNVTFSWNTATTGCYQWGIFTAFANTSLLIEHNRVGNVTVQHCVYVSNSDTANDSPTVRFNEMFGCTDNGLQFNGDCTSTNNGVTDGAISNAQVYGNYIHDNGWNGLSAIALQNSVVHDNIFSHNGVNGSAGEMNFSTQSGCPQTSSNNVISNNSVYCPLVACLRIDASPAHGTGNVIFNNIAVGPVFGACPGQICDESPGTNFIDAGSNYQNTSTAGIWVTAPVNATPSGGDFHLLSGSPAAGVGIVSYRSGSCPVAGDCFASSTDYAGMARPTNGRYDSGAYQFQSGGGVSQVGNCQENLATNSSASTQRSLNVGVSVSLSTGASGVGTKPQNVYACHP